MNNKLLESLMNFKQEKIQATNKVEEKTKAFSEEFIDFKEKAQPNVETPWTKEMGPEKAPTPAVKKVVKKVATPKPTIRKVKIPEIPKIKELVEDEFKLDDKLDDNKFLDMIVEFKKKYKANKDGQLAIPFIDWYMFGIQLEKAGFVYERGGRVVLSYFPWSILHTILTLVYGEDYEQIQYGTNLVEHFRYDENENGTFGLVRAGFKLYGETYTHLRPILDHTNSSVMYATSGQMNYTSQRAYAKAVAMNLGLGMHLFNKGTGN